MLGVWIEPVVAHVMMTLPFAAMLNSPFLGAPAHAFRPPMAGSGPLDDRWSQLSQRSSGGTSLIDAAKAAWACASTSLLSTRVEAGFFASLAFGRIGL